jgi:glycosyltransferase involved in cell wall biosynthesis
VIPTHNRARLLEEALVSVFAQEGDGDDFDMEVVVVDDASSDDTPEVLEKYPQARHIRLTTNHGEGGARNAGIKASRGEYIAFLDDDDFMLPRRLKLQVPLLEAHPEIGVVYSQNIMRGRWAPDAPVLERSWPDAGRAPSGDVFEVFLKEEFLSMDTLIVRREAFEKAGYFENYPTGAHYDMFLRLAFHVPFLFVAGDVAVNRVHAEGVFHARLAGEDGYGRMLPMVVDKALAMLPDTAYSRTLRREVHACLVPRLFCMLERIPDLEGMRSYVKIVLRECPWLLTEAAARRAFAENARLFRLTQFTPTAVAQVVCEEIQAAGVQSGLKDRLRLRMLLADIWMVLAVSLGFAEPVDYAQTGYAAGRAFFNDPRSVISADGLKLAFRLVFGARAYSFLRLLKRPARANLADL